MGTGEYDYPKSNFEQQPHKVAIPPPQPFIKSLKTTVKETFFPDDPLRQFKNQPPSRKFVLGVQYFFPIFDWGSRYNLSFFKSDIIAGITIASLAIPQGISYAKLANLPPILGLCKLSNFSGVISPLSIIMVGLDFDINYWERKFVFFFCWNLQIRASFLH